MRQKLGQHFLLNPSVSKKIGAALEVAAGDTVIEVGPGHGELTQAVLSEFEKAEAVKQSAQLIAVEKDPILAEQCKSRFKENAFVKIVQADVFEFLDSTDGKRLVSGQYKITGNFPYYITGNLLRVISEMENKPALSVFMIQKEVAERMVAKPPQMNRLAAAVQFWAEPKIVLQVSRHNFKPPPEVDSAVVLLRSKTEAGDRKTNIEKNAAFYKTLRTLFAQPRKTVLNNLRSDTAVNINTAKGTEILTYCGVDPKSRPQNLSVETIKKIATRVQASNKACAKIKT